MKHRKKPSVEEQILAQLTILNVLVSSSHPVGDRTQEEIVGLLSASDLRAKDIAVALGTSEASVLVAMQRSRQKDAE